MKTQPSLHLASKKSARRAAGLATVIVLASFATAGSAGAAAAVAFRSSSPGGHMHPATSGQLLVHQATMMDQPHTFHCQLPSAKFNCYGPSQIRAAYDIQPLLDAGRDGSGQVITIIDAYQNPTMASDLAAFDSAWGLVAPPSFTTIAPFGLTSFNANDANQVGWSGEIALDVEWAHAVAPGASIVLALAPSDADADILATERYVIQHRLGNVVSMSFGEAEACMDPHIQATEHSLFAAATANGMTFLAGSGDSGAAELSCDGTTYSKAVSIPASDPSVTAVGGTDLHANLTSGAYIGERVWNEPFTPAAGGGGFSSVYSQPSFQGGAVGGAMRGLPDVAWSASLAHGVVVAWGSSGSPNEFWIFFGTSVGTPQWAAVVAIANQVAGHGLGNINAHLYALGQSASKTSPFHDITEGDNSFGSVVGYSAARGWDAASGWGSPDVNVLVPALAR
jgi:subtilase family serine protease